MAFDDADYEQEKNVELDPTRCRKIAWRPANPFIDAKAGVDGDASEDERSDDENVDCNGFIVADVVEYYIIYHLYQFIKYFIAFVHYIF